MMMKMKASEIPYLVEIKTGDVKNIGAVYLSIYGAKGEIEKLALKENRLKKPAFEKNKLDEFELYAPDVGEVNHVNSDHTL